MLWRRALVGLLLVILPMGFSGQARGLSHAPIRDRSFALTAVTELWLANGYPGLHMDRQPVRIQTRIWYAGPDDWRIERHYLTPPPQAALVGVFLHGPSLFVRHGSIVWVYYARTRTYASRSPLDVEVSYPSTTAATFEAAALGEPFPLGTPTSGTLLPFVRALGSCDTAKIGPISVPRVIGSATLLGRAAAIIDFGPRPCGWTSASEGEMMGRRLLWIDRQTFLLLKMARYSVYNRTHLFERVTVTRFHAHGPLPATLFRFTAPSGARHAPSAPPPLAPTKVASLTAIRQHIAFSLFLPAWLPHHLTLRHATVDGTPHVALTYGAPGYDLSILEGPVGCCLDSDPRKYGGPTLPDGRVVNLLSIGAAYGGVIVWWDQGQTYIALSSSTLTRADLLHVATAIRAS